MPVIDVHTHIFTKPWLELLKRKGGLYNIQQRADGQHEVFRGDTPVVIPQKGHFDYDLRIQHMDAAGIDISVMSLTCPNVFWGDEETSCEAARESNDSQAQAQAAHPSRLRWFTSLPWEYPQRALDELKRTCDNGASGVMVLANIAGRSLTDPAFAPIWAEIDRRALPVLVHPTDPPGADLMDMTKFDLSWSVGFMFDTTLAITRMIFEGFFDQYPNLKIIASHAGGALPYLAGRFGKGHEVEIPPAAQDAAHAHRLPAPHPLRLHLVQSGFAGVPDLRRRRRPRDVRHRLAAPGSRHARVLRQYRAAVRRAARRRAFGQCQASIRFLIDFD